MFAFLMALSALKSQPLAVFAQLATLGGTSTGTTTLSPLLP